MFSLRAFRFVSGVGVGAGPGVGLVQVLVLMLVLVLVLVLVLALVLVLMLVLVLCFQREVASSVSPLPCLFRNMLENRCGDGDTEVATSLSLHLCFFKETWHPLCLHLRLCL